jgi:diguanylate cyclase (GGDEF)-like protein
LLQNGSVVISLRKHIDAYAIESVETPVGAYREILLAIARAAGEATPYLGPSFQQKLKGLNEGLGDAPAPDRMLDVHREADREIAAWAEEAAGYLHHKAREVKEIMIAVANAAASTSERDHRYAGRFNQLTTSLQSIARLEDLTTIRRSLVESAEELRSCADKMASEGAAAISQLTAEVSAYRLKLEESERRETIDPLTSLPNRRGIETRIEERILSRTGFSLAMLDVNGFKKINDQYGHLAGDDLLRQFAGELQNQLKPGGIVGRWGGDEFLVIVPAAFAQAETAMARVRRWAFGSYRLKVSGKSIQVNVTAAEGLAEWNGKETTAELLARADERMYTAKRASHEPVLAR